MRQEKETLRVEHVHPEHIRMQTQTQVAQIVVLDYINRILEQQNVKRVDKEHSQMQ